MAQEKNIKTTANPLASLSVVSGTVRMLRYKNEDGSYGIYSIQPDDPRQHLYGISGAICDLEPGQHYTFWGNKTSSQKYGQQLSVVAHRLSVPQKRIDIMRFFRDGHIDGIDGYVGEMILNKFGNDTYRVLEETPERVREVKGISEKDADRIVASMRALTEVSVDAVRWLVSKGVPKGAATSMYRQLGERVFQEFSANPYKMVGMVRGFTFAQASRLAKEDLSDESNKDRIAAGLYEAVSRLTREQGDCFVSVDDACRMAASPSCLDMPKEDIIRFIEENGDLLSASAQSAKVIVEDGRVYPVSLYRAEGIVAERLDAILSGPPAAGRVFSSGEVSLSTGINYSDEQGRAIESAQQEKIIIGTGGPGTGKTCMLLGMLNAFERQGKSVLCAAPTGRAAQRMSEVTGHESSTIHRLLGYGPDGFSRNEDNPLECDVVVIDESSMIDIQLMAALLRAVPDSAQLVLVGDVNQLPSVGPGMVLKDMIESGTIPVAKLSKVFRQSKDSGIISAAYDINSGKLPVMKGSIGEGDYVFLDEPDTEAIAKKITTLFTELPQQLGISVADMQILSPTKRANDPIGTRELNRAIQEAVNPGTTGVRWGGIDFREHDRVIQMVNDPDKGIVNGQVGVITQADQKTQSVSVRFEGMDNDVVFGKDELETLDLAYAITIHKSQGSEYPVVISPASTKHSAFDTRELRYVDATRAKRLHICIGEKKALRRAVANVGVEKRNTSLAERISGKAFSKEIKSKLPSTAERQLTHDDRIGQVLLYMKQCLSAPVENSISGPMFCQNINGNSYHGINLPILIRSMERSRLGIPVFLTARQVEEMGLNATGKGTGILFYEEKNVCNRYDVYNIEDTDIEAHAPGFLSHLSALYKEAAAQNRSTAWHVLAKSPVAHYDNPMVNKVISLISNAMLGSYPEAGSTPVPEEALTNLNFQSLNKVNKAADEIHNLARKERTWFNGIDVKNEYKQFLSMGKSTSLRQQEDLAAEHEEAYTEGISEQYEP